MRSARSDPAGARARRPGARRSRGRPRRGRPRRAARSPAARWTSALMLLGRSADTLGVGFTRLQGSKLVKALLICAAAALLAVPAAFAGPGLRVGAVEDSAVWSSDPGAEMDLAKLAGFD